jgi:hypothetical protein
VEKYRNIHHLMEPLNYRIPTVVLSISFYVLFIGGDNGPTVYATNTSGSWTDGMLLTMTLDLNNSLPVLSHYADPFIAYHHKSCEFKSQ